MRKSVPYVLAALLVLLAVVATTLYQKTRKASADYAELKASDEATRGRFENTLQAIAEIQDSLDAISLGDGSMRELPGGATGEKLNTVNGQQALDRIAVLRAGIARSKNRIRQLEHSLKVNGNKLAGLQKMVERLNQDVAQKEQIVAELTGRVDTLTTRVAGLQNVVEENQATIEQKRRELATVYLAVGDRKQLAAHGVIVAKGGLLGLGKTLQPSGLTDPSAFTPLDTDQETVVPIASAKARVLSAQAPTSYELRLNNGQLELHILDPQEFRKVRQVVILTA